MKNKNRIKKTMLLLSVLLLVLTPIMAFSEAVCEDGACIYDGEIGFILTDDLKLSLEINDVVVNQTQISLSPNVLYPFEIGYNRTTGIIHLEMNGQNVTFISSNGMVYDELKAIVYSNLGFDLVHIQNLAINSTEITSLLQSGVPPGGETTDFKGVTVTDWDSGKFGVIVTGNFQANSLGISNTKEPMAIYLNGGEYLPFPDAVILSGATTEASQTLEINDPSAILGALSVTIFLNTQHFIEGLGGIIWKEVYLNEKIMDYEVLIFPTNEIVDFENIIYGDVFETTEPISIGACVDCTFETISITDGNLNGFSVISQFGEAVSIMPSGEYDLYGILNN